MLSIEVVNDTTHSFIIKSLRMLPLPQNSLRSFDKLVDYWVESCGHVYYICVLVRQCMDWRIRMVKICELDLVGNKWVEVKSLDGRAFFLGQDCSTWCWGSNSGDGSGCVQGDCIYFPVQKREYFDNTIYYCYSLNEGNLSMKLFRSDLQRHYAPIWLNLMPQHHNLLGVQDMKGQELTQIKENVDEGLDYEMFSYSTSYNECHREENGIQGKRPQLSELPHHLINLISKNMHLFDLWNFRVTCKTFHDAVPQPQHRTNNMLPLFVVLKNDGRSCEIIDPSLNYSCSSILQLSSDPFAIEFFKEGWLLISVGSKRLLKYFNPFSRVSGDFPSDVDIHRFTRIGFSTHPTSPDCVTVVIDDSIPCAIKIYCIKYGDELWDSFTFPRHNFFFGASSPIYIAGTFYILDAYRNLGAFTLIDGKGSWRIYNWPNIIRGCRRNRAYLVESDKELHFVCIHDDWGPWIKVFKFNLLEDKWYEVKSLGNYSFFLSHTFSFSVEITKAGMQNRIYLSRLKGNGVLFYSLETHKYHVLGTEDSMEHFSGTRELMQCCWL